MNSKLEKLAEGVIALLREASDEALHKLEYDLRGVFAKYNGVSNYDPNKKWSMLVAAESQLKLVRAEKARRVSA